MSNGVILDEMTTGAVGVRWQAALRKTLDLVYEIPDSDRCEVLLRFVGGPVLLLSCDPQTGEDGRRTPDRWEVVVYDASDTVAGREVRRLKPGYRA